MSEYTRLLSYIVSESRSLVEDKSLDGKIFSELDGKTRKDLEYASQILDKKILTVTRSRIQREPVFLL